jgi:hypothetical protein
LRLNDLEERIGIFSRDHDTDHGTPPQPERGRCTGARAAHGFV